MKFQHRLRHSKSWGQAEVEEHQAAISGNRVCHYCLPELEEKYGFDKALRIGHIDY